MKWTDRELMYLRIEVREYMMRRTLIRSHVERLFYFILRTRTQAAIRKMFMKELSQNRRKV